MDKFEVLIIGRGKLANELLGGLSGDAISRVIRWEDRSETPPSSGIVVHAGSGRELTEAIEYCAKTESTLFELSTSGFAIPEKTDFPVIVCPNVNLQMLCFMAMVKRFSGLFKGRTIRITESHQSSKKTKPGTAIYLAKSLGILERDIVSERDPERQQKIMGIPKEHLDRHACHQIVISDPEVEIRLETRVLGKSAYSSGLSKIIGIIAKKRLAPGKYDIVDIIIE
jgi:dihydrodipicolinate reductase